VHSGDEIRPTVSTTPASDIASPARCGRATSTSRCWGAMPSRRRTEAEASRPSGGPSSKARPQFAP